MPRVLTIDDSRTLRAIVRDTLTHHRFDVVEARNGSEGLEKARLTRPDAILLDLHMPVMDGRETLLRLREDPETEAIPVIILTTEAAQEAVVELVKMGLAGYVVKPFQAADLIAKLKRAIALGEGAAPPARTTRDTASTTQTLAGPEDVVQEDMDAASGAGEVVPADTSAPSGTGRRPVLLAVDDTPDVLDLLEEYLAEGVEFVRASSGLEAVNLIQGSTPDAVLLDLDMPGATGADVFRETAELLKSHGSLVWGMASSSEEDDITRARRAGIRNFLAKPFDESELAGIADTIRQRAAPDAPGR